MSRLKHRMQEDRALRDAARALVEADVAHLRNNFSGPGLTERMAEKVSDGARDVFDKASDAADNHKGILAALIGGVLIWFARTPILSLFEKVEDEDGQASEFAEDDGQAEPSPQSEIET